jgi:hypothetical protein
MTAEMVRADAPSQAVARRSPVADKILYAQALAASGMLPRQYQGNPANLLYAVEYAEMLGCHPLTAVTGVHVIEGKPSASAALISALVRKAGHRLRVTGDTKSATAQITRADDPDFTFEVTFTLEDAAAANLTGKGVWKSYPASMLKARAITQCARDACEDALSGLHYTAEELGAEVDEEGIPVGTVVVNQRPAAEPIVERAGVVTRGPAVTTLDDPWALPIPEAPVVVTDEAWLTKWVTLVTSATNEDEMRVLWAEMVTKHTAKELTDSDRVDLTETFRTAAKELVRIERALATAEASDDNAVPAADETPVGA